MIPYLSFLGVKNFETQTNRIIEWLATIYSSLLPKNVIIWDSFLPVAKASIKDCFKLFNTKESVENFPNYKNFSKEQTWKCWDRAHIGFESLEIALQMTLNFLCNQFMQDNQYCCSS